MLGFIFSTPPHVSAQGREGLDALLATSAFSDDLQVFFVGDGVLQLLKAQDTSALKTKNYIQAFGLLELYDVETIYVCQQSLDKFNLTQDDLILPVQVLSPEQVAIELNTCHKIIRF